MNDTLTLTDEKVLKEAQETLAAHLQLQAEGYKCKTTDLLNVLMAMTMDLSSIQLAYGYLPGLQSAEAIRRYINEKICIKELPQAHPPRLQYRLQNTAIDVHDSPDYGEKLLEESEQGRAQDATARFYHIFSAYFLVNSMRVRLVDCCLA